MGCVNKVTLIGNLGRDADVRAMPNGVPVATLTVATVEVWKNKEGENTQQIEWHRVVIIGDRVTPLAPSLKKGRQVYVEGSLHYRSWKNAENLKQYTTEIKAHRVMVLGNQEGN